jgi:flagellar protein FlaG
MIHPASPLDSRAPAPTPAGNAAARDAAGAQSLPVAPAARGDVHEAMAAINRAAKALNNSVELSLDADSGRAVVRVIDSESGALIRQIPSEEVLELRRALERVAGLLIHRTA